MGGAETLTNETVTDTTFVIQDDTDNTKKAKSEASGINTNTTRTYTLPNAHGSLITAGDTRTVPNAMLATISTARKVANAATTAANANITNATCGKGCKW